MEDELTKFIKVWTYVLLSLCYCFAIGKIVPKGTKRLVFLLPVVGLFVLLPFELSSVHLGGITAFFIGWLAIFKLLLFAFGKGPLCSNPPLSLSLFVAVSCLPIKIQQESPPNSYSRGQNVQAPGKSNQNGHAESDFCDRTESPSEKSNQNGRIGGNPASKSRYNGQNGEIEPVARRTREGPLNYAIKGVLLGLLIKAYDYSDYMNPKMILALYSFHIYFVLELFLALGASMARVVLGLELEPQFNEPYLATSLQDFWGRRWNLMVTSILRPTVYDPTLGLFSALVGRKWAPLPAVFSTFVASAAMHEMQFYYLGRMRPSWNVTWFFIIHGTCVTAEIALKKATKGRWRLPELASRILTVGFVMATGLWLFFPEFRRCKVDVKAFEEYATIGAWWNNVERRLGGLW